MNLRSRLSHFVGQWTGTYQLWLSPDEPVRRSQTKASIALAARDAFATLTYTWSDGDTPHDGVLVVRNAAEPSERDMVWVDSFHTMGGFMIFAGEHDADGRVCAVTSYPAPPGPDWGWRIALSADRERELLVLMYNIAPGGEIYPAVEARYSRAAAG